MSTQTPKSEINFFDGIESCNESETVSPQAGSSTIDQIFREPSSITSIAGNDPDSKGELETGEVLAGSGILPSVSDQNIGDQIDESTTQGNANGELDEIAESVDRIFADIDVRQPVADVPNVEAESSLDPPDFKGLVGASGWFPEGIREEMANQARATSTQSISNESSIQSGESLVVDPETGEVLERNIICEKMGWVELPTLPENPTNLQLEMFSEKLDQVVDRICTYKDKINRYNEQNAYRVTRLEGAIGWWSTWLKPYAEKLGEAKLKRFAKGEKKGEFKEKTLHLSSGNISFRVTGGWDFESYAVAIKHIEAHPEMWPDFKCQKKSVLDINYQTALSVLKQGKYNNIPGTKKTEEKALGKMDVKGPKE